jgi:uncharacterized membrane protein YdjX (TVP38/TMEM64 family)
VQLKGMNEQVIELLQQFKPYALIISIFINILISIIGFLPSVFLSAANLVVFGFWEGLLISFIGEGVGAVVAFMLYRKGFRRITETKAFSYPMFRRLLEVEGKQAFSLVLSLRLLPFVPSGVVTFIAAIGKISLIIFAVSSTLGKLPSLIIEAYSVNQMVQWTLQGKIITALLATFLLIYTLKSFKK